MIRKATRRHTAIRKLLDGAAPSEYKTARVFRQLAAEGQNSAKLVSRNSVEDVAERLCRSVVLRGSSYRLGLRNA